MNESRFTSGTDWTQCKPDQDEFIESGYGTSAVALMSVVVSYGHVQRRLRNIKGLLDIAI